MGRFFVGQRVRIVKAEQPENRHRNGSEDVIAAAYGVMTCADGSTGDSYQMAGDPARMCRNSLFWRVWGEWQLEPIVPEGAAPSELSFTELMDRCRAGEVVPV